MQYAKDSNDPLVQEALRKIASGELTLSSGPIDVTWTEEDKKRLNEALAKCFGWNDKMEEQRLIATPELVDTVAKAIVKSRMISDSAMKGIYEFFKGKEELPKFVETFNHAVNEVWEGKDADDEENRTLYRNDARATLKALGYEVEITTPSLRDVLV